jgi:hypothetical protein
MDWEFILKTLSALGIGAGTVAYIARTVIKTFLDRDIEHYKAELRAVHESALERLRADLRIEAFQKETVFAKLHAKRAEVIQELYGRLVAVSRAMNDFMSPLQIGGGPSREEKKTAAADAANAFLDYYLTNEIYFDEGLCDKLQSFAKLKDAWHTFDMYPPDESGVASERRKVQFIAWKKVNEELPKIRGEIAAILRKLLGHSDREGTDQAPSIAFLPRCSISVRLP